MSRSSAKTIPFGGICFSPPSRARPAPVTSIDPASVLPLPAFCTSGSSPLIIRGGENIYPREIEEFLYTHPKVKDVQVIGVPDEQYGEEIMACIILKEGEESSVEEIRAFVLSHMAKHKVPRPSASMAAAVAAGIL